MPPDIDLWPSQRIHIYSSPKTNSKIKMMFTTEKNGKIILPIELNKVTITCIYTNLKYFY